MVLIDVIKVVVTKIITTKIVIAKVVQQRLLRKKLLLGRHHNICYNQRGSLAYWQFGSN